MKYLIQCRMAVTVDGDATVVRTASGKAIRCSTFLPLN